MDIEKSFNFEEQKEKVLSYIKSNEYIPLKKQEFYAVLSVPEGEKQLFDEIIDALLAEGSVVETKKGKIFTPKKLNLVTGTFLSNAKGYGFVSSPEFERDIFIPADHVNGAMHKDTVLCRINEKAAGTLGAEGEIIKIVSKGITETVGTFERGKGYGFVIPDNKKLEDIFIDHDNTMGAVTGHKVVVKIIKRSEGKRNPEGKITEILGHADDPGVDILSIIREYELPGDFPDDVKGEIKNVETEINSDEIKGREDYRSLQTVTIDGEDAKDFDDAISISRLPDGAFRLYVHIADVSYYVKEYSPLDKEAYLRGTSIYLVDRVIPMLPHQLSNGICSLNPDEDRLALSCVMDIDKNGNVISHKISNSVIHSDRRMTYTKVNLILTENDPALCEEYKDFLTMFRDMEELRGILLKRRQKRGSIDFDLPEAKIILDENGKPKEIKASERNVATSIIEEFMLICNETVAEEYFWQNIPFVYRVHEVPDEEKLKTVYHIIASFGYRLKNKDEIHPKEIQKLLENASKDENERIISRLILRSMKQAKYMAANLGHFGLAAKYYCHFTSPIRRYPDLQIHRIIKENIAGMPEKRINHYEKILEKVSSQSSFRERLAEEAERETDNLKKAEFMLDKIGMEFEGVISGLTKWGIYVELPNTVEGMVALKEMDDDYYYFDEENMVVTGERSKKVYRLGANVKVKVTGASTELRTVDFIFANE